MRNYLIKVSFAVALVGAVAGVGGAGCGSDNASPTGAAGHAGSTTGRGGSTGLAGGAAGTTGVAGGTAGGSAEGGAGGGGGGQSPQQIHEGLINKPTTGGITPTRQAPTKAYPGC